MDMNLLVSCNENLHRWEDALNDYKMKELKDPNGENYFLPRLRCYYALSDWETILN
jgi:hypothetical protein